MTDFQLTQLTENDAICHSASQLPIVENAEVAGIYIHIPFCFHKCHYCDFYSFVDTRDQQPTFLDRLIREIEVVAERLSHPIETIFIGGGTPTLLQIPLWKKLLHFIHDRFPLAADLEFSVEANPETVTAELLDVLTDGGVNRLSIGAQSFSPELLKALERWHDPANVAKSIDLARAAGIDNINLDLIAAIPGSSLDDWQHDLESAFALRPTHLSCYTLMYETNTPLTRKFEESNIQRIDEDLEAAMYEWTIDRFSSSPAPPNTDQFEHYEISNWAKPGYRCQHNLLYWQNRNWWALGPSASGHVNGVRWKNVPRLGDYLATEDWSPVVDVEQLSEQDRVGEILMLRLRMLDGIENEELAQLLGADQPGRQATINRFLQTGLLQLNGPNRNLQLTRKGLLLADSVFGELL